jgi:hypothetical protein
MADPEQFARLAFERARQRPCCAIRQDGRRCRSFASGLGRFCFAHDPARRDAAQEARRKGGAATRKPRFAEVLRERVETEINKIIAAHVAALESGDERVRLHAAGALLAAARGSKGLRDLPPVLGEHAWTIEDAMLPNALAIGYDSE